MKSLTVWIKSLFATMNESEEPRTCMEWTMHDAIRLCHSQSKVEEAASPASRSERRQVDFYPYGSEDELRDQWNRLDVPCSQSRRTTIFVLGTRISRALKGLVRRHHHASQLIIVPVPGNWPGVDSPADLALSAPALGWDSIEVCRNLGKAIEQGFSTLNRDERLSVISPPWTQIFELITAAADTDITRRTM